MYSYLLTYILIYLHTHTNIIESNICVYVVFFEYIINIYIYIFSNLFVYTFHMILMNLLFSFKECYQSIASNFNFSTECTVISRCVQTILGYSDKGMGMEKENQPYAV